MAGLDGIEKGIEPGEPNLVNLYGLSREDIGKRGLVTLPQSLREALAALESDKVVLDALGPIQNEFLKLKWQEWNEYHRQISQWEIDQYLTFF
jgi:glutamine synthetase